MEQLKELDPELFTWELYNADMLREFNNTIMAVHDFGYCDASRLYIRPRSGLYALMITWENGDKEWAHVDRDTIEHIRKYLARRGK